MNTASADGDQSSMTEDDMNMTRMTRRRCMSNKFKPTTDNSSQEEPSEVGVFCPIIAR